MLTALLDTCVLWPSLQRDFLLSLAIEDVYRPLWSRAILDELEYEEARKLRDRGTGPATAEAGARHLIVQMGRAFHDAETSPTVRGHLGSTSNRPRSSPSTLSPVVPLAHSSRSTPSRSGPGKRMRATPRPTS